MRKLSHSGNAAIEFALIAPILVLIVFGVIEFGVYILKSQLVSRAVSVTASSIQANPTEPSLQTLAQNGALPLVNLGASPNYICAQSYTTQAETSASCTGTTWNTLRPNSVAVGAPYFVVVRAHAAHSPFTSFIPGLTEINHSTVFQVGTQGGMPTCAANNILVNRNNSWVCTAMPQCTGRGMALQYNNGSFACADLFTNVINGPACSEKQLLTRNGSGQLVCRDVVNIRYTPTVGQVSDECAGTMPNINNWVGTCGKRYCVNRGYGSGHVTEWTCQQRSCLTEVLCW